MTLCVGLLASLGKADCCCGDTLFYLTAAGAGEGATPVSPQETLEFFPSGGSFHIWVQPDTLLNGISLDVDAAGSAIRFTDATVHNPAVGTGTRWLPSLIRNGTVTDEQVSRIEGGALAPLTGFGAGVGPSTSSSDLLYEATGGFLFATIDFEAASPTATGSVSLSIGRNLISDTSGVTTSSILLGAGDGPVTNTDGATGSVVDLLLQPGTVHPSDFDVDGDVDGRDLLAWQDGFGITSGALKSDGDANADGKVDAADLVVWESQYGTVPAGPLSTLAVVPEPSMLTLFGVGLLVSNALCQRCLRRMAAA